MSRSIYRETHNYSIEEKQRIFQEIILPTIRFLQRTSVSPSFSFNVGDFFLVLTKQICMLTFEIV